MTSKATSRIESLPVLFAYIGWAERYDGTEPIKGGFSHFKKKSADISEACGFHRDSDGLYRCGVGSGDLGDMRLNVVLVARENRYEPMKIVGLYPAAKIEMDDYWAVAACKHPNSNPSSPSAKAETLADRPRVAAMGMERRRNSREGVPPIAENLQASGR